MSGRLSRVLLVILFALALAVRLYAIGSPSNDFHTTRQYYSAFMVRPLFLEAQPDTPAWRLDIARQNQPAPLEPPVLQAAALAGYLIAGQEALWIPRTIAALSWVVGGFFLYLLGRRLFRAEAALVATAFYLFAPYGIAASRSFQPNPLMVALMVAGMYALLRYFDRPTWPALMAAAVTSALAIFVLPLAAFFLFPLYAWLAVVTFGWRRAIRNPHTIAFGLVSLLPTALYYAYGLFVAGFLRGQTGNLFMPGLWTNPQYWINWPFRMLEVIGLIPFILSIQALLTTRQPRQAAVLRSLWLAYLIFGLLANYPIFTHNYYSLPLIPIAALSISGVVDGLLARVRPKAARTAHLLASGAVLAIVIAGLIRYLPTTVVTEEQQAAIDSARIIGEEIEHSPDAIFLTGDYGTFLRYYGEIAGTSWPGYSDLYAAKIMGVARPPAQERLEAMLAENDYRYFVISSLPEADLQPDLMDYLDATYPVMARGDAYIIYALNPAS